MFRTPNCLDPPDRWQRLGLILLAGGFLVWHFLRLLLYWIHG